MTDIIHDLIRDIIAHSDRILPLETLIYRYDLSKSEVRSITCISGQGVRNYINCNTALRTLSNGGTFENTNSDVSWLTFNEMDFLMRRLEKRSTPVQEYLDL